MKKNLYLGVLSILITSCTKNYESLIMIGQPRKNVISFINDYETYQQKSGSKSYLLDRNDTISYISYHENLPFELLYLFKSDTCSYQEANLYCAPCAEEAIEAILKDTKYKFKAADGSNYISQKNTKIIMRHTKSNRDSLLCNKISVRKI